MLRCLLIAIFSLVLPFGLCAQSVTDVKTGDTTGRWTYTNDHPSGRYLSFQVVYPTGNPGSKVFRYLASGASWSSGASWAGNYTLTRGGATLNVEIQSGTSYVPLSSHALSLHGYGMPSPTPTPSPTPSPSPTPVEPVGTKTGEYDLQLGAEFVGQRVVIKDEFGNVLFDGIVGEDGLAVSGEVTREWYEGDPEPGQPQFTVEYYRPGINQETNPWVLSGTGTLGQSGTNNEGNPVSSTPTWTETGKSVTPAGTTYNQGGNTYVSQGGGTYIVSGPNRTTVVNNVYNFPAASGGGQWSLVNPGGGIVNTGVIPEGGGPVGVGGATYSGESGLSVVYQPLVVGGDGTPALGAPVSLGPLNPSGSVLPLPSPGPSPTPVPSPPGNPLPDPTPLPPDSVSPGSGGDQTTVSYEDPQWPIPDDDLNEQIQEQSATMLELFGSILGKVNDFGQTFSDGVSGFAGAGIGSPGAGCSFVMGTTTINLNVPSGVRSGTAVVAYIMTMIAIAALVNRLMDAS